MGLSFENDRNVIVSSLDELALTDGLVLYYTMDSIDGATLLDNSGNNYHGTNYGATPTTGINGNALSFNGTSNYVQSSYPNSTAYTLSCWYKGTHLPLALEISLFNIARANGSTRIGLHIDTNGYLNVYNYSNNLTTTTKVNNNVWHHCVATNTGTNAFIYVDGEQRNTAAYPLTTDYFNQLRIGRNVNDTYCSGLIDEVRLYNRALSAAEVKQLYKLNAPNNVASMKEE
jgi:hypothetical protein